MNASLYEREEVVRYVELEAPDEEVTHAEKLTTRTVAGKRYEIWDVWTDQRRWWVISPLTNLYDQGDFQSLDMALTFHLGIMERMSSRSRSDTMTREHHAFLAAFRKLERASEAMNEAEEAETSKRPA